MLYKQTQWCHLLHTRFSGYAKKSHVSSFLSLRAPRFANILYVYYQQTTTKIRTKERPGLNREPGSVVVSALACQPRDLELGP
jgi:hypothetical protein